MFGILFAIIGVAWNIYLNKHDFYLQGCYRSHEKGPVIVSVCLQSLCFLCCCACYAICFVQVRITSEALQARAWQRARLYPLVVLASFGPVMLALVGLVQITPAFAIICITLLCLNGSLNTLVYFVQRRFALRSESRYCSIGDMLLPDDLRYQFANPEASLQRSGPLSNLPNPAPSGQ